MPGDKSELDDITSFSQKDITENVVQKLLQGFHLPKDVHVTSSMWQDSELKPWVDCSLQTTCGKDIAWHILQHPTANPQLLHQRQCALKYIQKSGSNIQQIVSQFHAVENDIHWLMTRAPISESTSLQLLYPSFFALRFINHLPYLLAALHIYKGYVSPCTNILTPLSTIFAPYMYLRKSMGSSLSMKNYLKLVATLLSKWVKPTGNLRTDAMRFGTLGLYLGMFAVGIVQSIELASSVRKLRKLILQKSKSIQNFVATNFLQLQQIPGYVWESYGIKEDNSIFLSIEKLPSGATLVYKFLSDSQTQHGFMSLLRRIYILDMLESLSRSTNTGIASYATFLPPTSPLSTRFYHMGHIQLPLNQVRNPCSLQKNLIITGPNAGGKTTYVKSICSNYLLAQTFGITISQHSLIQLQHAFGSFMRIHDEVGNKSLFEAEVSRCAEIIAHAEYVSKSGRKATYFLDEPMHSTPPAEGASASIATVEYLGKLSGIRVITTTHFFQLTGLEKEHPQLFQNISMEAIPRKEDTNDTFKFPYRIRKGPSYQCIALELLKQSDIPQELVSCAIKWKNKICAMHVINDP